MLPTVLEIWASPEATVARIDATRVRDQLLESGHDRRDDDVDLLAALGVRATRYPVLWERCAPDQPGRVNLTWARDRLNALARRGIEPVVTLLHHGYGPRYTSLLDPAFPRLFADYAGHVARAFPWVRRWTPINEPTTTARFSTLYGFWYPNRHMDHAAFGRAIVHQALGMLLAMREIRRYAPGAEFVLTEDLQHFAAAGPSAAAYCEHKLHRSFLTIDLVLGRVKPQHPLWSYLRDACGIAAADLDRVRAAAAAPQLLGFNYYANSERYVARRDDGSFENVARVDVGGSKIDPKPLLRAAHARFGLPFGFTEIHLCGSERDRVAWLLERVSDARTLVAEGLPCVVAGAWAAFGMVDWRSLLTRRDSTVEDGVYTFAGRHRTPQATAVASTIQALARGTLPAPPPGVRWWQSPDHRQPPKHISEIAPMYAV